MNVLLSMMNLSVVPLVTVTFVPEVLVHAPSKEVEFGAATME